MPELSIYEEGVPPESGTYRMTFDGDRVRVTIHWRTAEGEERSMEFGGRCDGARRPSPQPGVATVSFTLIDPCTLDSAAYDADGTQQMYARRRSSRDGSLLTTLQRIRRADGSSCANFQVYRRGV